MFGIYSSSILYWLIDFLIDTNTALSKFIVDSKLIPNLTMFYWFFYKTILYNKGLKLQKESMYFLYFYLVILGLPI